jgi:hypothetical protein
MGRPKQSHCAKGHALVDGNLYFWKDKRACIICRREINQRHDASPAKQRYIRANRKKLQAARRRWYANSSCTRRQWNKDYIDKIRHEVIVLLGGKCANPNCRWMNLDGTLGCIDERMLQIDHPKGGGNKEYKAFGGNRYGYFQKILRLKGEGYRLLCAGCNWWHRFEDF